MEQGVLQIILGFLRVGSNIEGKKSEVAEE